MSKEKKNTKHALNEKVYTIEHFFENYMTTGGAFKLKIKLHSNKHKVVVGLEEKTQIKYKYKGSYKLQDEYGRRQRMILFLHYLRWRPCLP